MGYLRPMETTLRMSTKERVRLEAFSRVKRGEISVGKAAKLVGLEPLIIAAAEGDGLAHRLLDFTTQLARSWCRCLREHGLDAIVFDSAAAPPVFGCVRRGRVDAIAQGSRRCILQRRYCSRACLFRV